jgi:hypothetical protein
MMEPDEMKALQQKAIAESVRAMQLNPTAPMAYGILGNTVLRFMQLAYPEFMAGLKTVSTYDDALHYSRRTGIHIRSLFGQTSFWTDDVQQARLRDVLAVAHVNGDVIEGTVKMAVTTDFKLELHYLTGKQHG